MKRDSTNHSYRFCGGFSLLELIVAVTILISLVAILIPAGQRVRASAQSSVCAGNLRQIGVGLQLYLNEHERTFPNLAAGPSSEDPENRPSLNTFLLEYVGKDPSVFICPGDDAPAGQSAHSSYHWNSLLNNQRAHNVKILGFDFNPTEIPVVFDAGAFHEASGNAVNFLFLDGSIDQAPRFRVGP